MLSGLRVLAVEDDPLMAETITDVLTHAEAIVLGPFSSAKQADDLLRSGTHVDVALLDLNFLDGVATPVLKALRAKAIPAVVYTGGNAPEALSRGYPGLRVIQKPVLPGRLTGELRRAWGEVPA